MQRALRAISRHVNFTLKEYLYVIILTFIFLFVSFLSYVRSEPHPDPLYSRFFLVHLGFPFEWLEIMTHATAVSHATVSFVALTLDFILYFMLAFVIVFTVIKLIDRMHE